MLAVDEVHDVHRPLGGEAGDALVIGILGEFGRQLVKQALHRLARLSQREQLIGDRTGAAGIADVLFARIDVHDRRGHRAARGEEVDLEHQHLLALIVEDVGQRRIGDEAAVPVEGAVDLDRRQPWRQGAGRHDVARIDPVGGGVEIAEIARFDVHGADRQARCAAVEPIPVDIFVERLRERRRIVEAERARRPRRRHERVEQARREEARHALHCDEAGRGKVDPLAPLPTADEGQRGQGGGDLLPKGAKLPDAVRGRIAGDDRGIDRADRDAGDPVDVDPLVGESLDDAALIGTERAAALQDEDDLIGQRQPLRRPGAAAAGGGRVGHCGSPRAPGDVMQVARL